MTDDLYDAEAEAAADAAERAMAQEQWELDLRSDPVLYNREVARRLKSLAAQADSDSQTERGAQLRTLAEDTSYTRYDWDGESDAATEPYEPRHAAHLRARREEAEAVLYEAGWEVFPAEEERRSHTAPGDGTPEKAGNFIFDGVEASSRDYRQDGDGPVRLDRSHQLDGATQPAQPQTTAVAGPLGGVADDPAGHGTRPRRRDQGRAATPDLDQPWQQPSPQIGQ